MGTIWNRNPSKLEVIGRCGRDVTKTNDHAEPTKSNAFFLYFYIIIIMIIIIIIL